MIGAGAAATQAPALRVSVVIPVLEEEARIAGQLAALAAIPGVHEAIVVDGGSRDRTLERARQFGEVRVLEAPSGRASQMNAGAAVATGDVLLFLHADVRLPRDAAKQVGSALADAAVVGGAFRTWTVAEGRRTWLAPFLHLADLRSRYTSLPYGDQAIFVRAAAFRLVGGFPEQPLMEDLEFSRRLSRVGRIRTLPATVRVSGRRFLARPLYYALLINLLPLLYRLRIPPRLFAGLYGNPR
jgi:rSAM/selenodomain-associated transferase 2